MNMTSYFHNSRRYSSSKLHYSFATFIQIFAFCDDVTKIRKCTSDCCW